MPKPNFALNVKWNPHPRMIRYDNCHDISCCWLPDAKECEYIAQFRNCAPTQEEKPEFVQEVLTPCSTVCQPSLMTGIFWSLTRESKNMELRVAICSVHFGNYFLRHFRLPFPEPIAQHLRLPFREPFFGHVRLPCREPICNHFGFHFRNLFFRYFLLPFREPILDILGFHFWNHVLDIFPAQRQNTSMHHPVHLVSRIILAFLEGNLGMHRYHTVGRPRQPFSLGDP